MKIRNILIVYIVVSFLTACSTECSYSFSVSEDRAYWVETMIKIVDPVLTNLSNSNLKKNMPFESLSTDSLRKTVSYLEAVGRTVCGVAPWLELGPDSTEEGKLRAKYINLTVTGIKNAVNPNSSDYLSFDNRHPQTLVDAAFLAQGLLRAPKQLWDNFDIETKRRIIAELKRTRSIKPYESNWLLFASVIEATLLEFAGEYDEARLLYGVNRFCKEWYKGDAWYGDGMEFHLDYYNSLVIHPMLTDVLKILKKHNLNGSVYFETQLKRLRRFAVQLERFISPEGTYPVVGRSIVYRFGIFHALSQTTLMDILPDELPAAQVRCALTAVIKRQLEFCTNFDKDGWLKVGFTGSQMNMSESYINTGSLYLCSVVFLPLGLSSEHSFWSAPYIEWTNLKAWKGIDVGRDKALKGTR